MEKKLSGLSGPHAATKFASHFFFPLEGTVCMISTWTVRCDTLTFD